MVQMSRFTSLATRSDWRCREPALNRSEACCGGHWYGVSTPDGIRETGPRCTCGGFRGNFAPHPLLPPHWQGGLRPRLSKRGTASVIGFHDTSRCCAGGFAKLVPGNVENGEAPPLLGERFGIRLDKNLDRLFAGINLDRNRRIVKVNLASSSVFPRMMAWGITVSL